MHKHLRKSGIICSIMILALAFASPAFAETEDGGILNVEDVGAEADALDETATLEAEKDTSTEAKEGALKESKAEIDG